MSGVNRTLLKAVIAFLRTFFIGPPSSYRPARLLEKFTKNMAKRLPSPLWLTGTLRKIWNNFLYSVIRLVRSDLTMSSSFYGVGAPRGTPSEIIDLLNREINAALADAKIAQRLGELGSIPISGNAEQFAAMLAAETDRWRKIVEKSGAKTN